MLLATRPVSYHPARHIDPPPVRYAGAARVRSKFGDVPGNGQSAKRRPKQTCIALPLSVKSPVMGENASLTVRRATSYADRFRAYKVTIDGTVVGKLRAADSLTTDISPGRHSIAVGIDWCSSSPIEFDAHPGEQVTFKCGSSMTGLRILLALFYISFAPKQYLWLERVR